MRVRRGVVLLLGAILTLAVRSEAGRPYVVYVAPPNGADDTDNIQAALSACVTKGPGCTVQLQAGTYLTRQLVTYNFQGTFKGMGQNDTTVEALPDLPVTFGDWQNGLCRPNTTDCIWPDLIVFVNGDTHISDMTIKITAVPSTQPWEGGGYTFTALIDVVRVMGDTRTNAYVQRVTMQGTEDGSDTSMAGYNVLNAMLYAGELPKSPNPYDYHFLSGTFVVSNSNFSTMFDGPAMDGFLKDSHIVFGGQPSGANVFEDMPVPLWLCNIQNSLVEVSHNVGRGMSAGLWVTPWLPPVFAPTKTSMFLIHDNEFQTSGPYATGIYLQDDPSAPALSALVSNNTIDLEGGLSDGIDASEANGTTILRNTVTGSGFDAIGLWNASFGKVIGNDVGGFTPEGGAQIYLDSGTNHDLVVRAECSDSVLDQGTNNMVISCQQSQAGPKAAIMNVPPAVSVPGPALPRGKPRPH
jgi:hypothetical protein